jgi:hypothetical protein
VVMGTFPLLDAAADIAPSFAWLHEVHAAVLSPMLTANSKRADLFNRMECLLRCGNER